MRAELEIWSAKRDSDFLQPILLGFCFISQENYEKGFEEFVNVRRKLGLYVNMAVMAPHLIKYAEKITLWDHRNIFVGKIETVVSLSQFVSSNLDRLNPEKHGVLRAQFSDNSLFEVPIPLTRLQVKPGDPTSIEY